MSSDLRLLVVGGSGELGQQVVKAAEGWEVHATYLRRPLQMAGECWYQLDITDHLAVKRLIIEVRPQAVIHTAVSAHDRSETFLSDIGFWTGIVEGGCYVAEAAAEVGARCIVLSTDLVFDGQQGNYTEDDPTNPILPYGQAKVDMERALLALGTNLAIVRTSLILTLEPMGKHVTWIVDALRRGESRDLFTDELRCPILSDELAVALLELLTHDYVGLLHVAGPEKTHRYALGMALAEYFSLDTSLITSALSAESGLHRPLNCTLDSSRAYSFLKTPIHGVSSRIGGSDQEMNE
jgi:dTDP-4-dehydrorhamnose reductase